jgi:polyvinyl alcohol dehydrogenase (cytochrome)
VDIETGEPRWIMQATANDAYNLSCDAGGPNCPDPPGPDVDFGAPPVLARLPDGTEMVIAGQKSGVVHALNPDTGEVVWQTRLGRGGALGGVHWGIAVHEPLSLAIIPISDRFAGPLTGAGEAQPGVHAVDLATGEIRWSHLR